MVIDNKEPPREAPVEYVTLCPETLPVPTITKEQWMTFTPEGQWDYVKRDIAKPWSSEYFKCAERHNTFVDWYLKDGMDD